MKVDVCICDLDECNRKMGEIETSSKSPETTTKGRSKKSFQNSSFGIVEKLTNEKRKNKI